MNDHLNVYLHFQNVLYRMIPTKGSEQSAGYDLYANDVGVLQQNERKLISTGVKMQIPNGCYGQICARSSMALKGIDIGAGVIDSDYTGEIKVLLINNSINNFAYIHGDKIAQIIILPLKKVTMFNATFKQTQRADKGFGSTGK
ncbi:uncharacterized protein LOC128959313 [Oppia nitens]|uniref:uncharacterized protein LOC128951281 n=1 Tax=Oppia nitens TaxID=1686743 RepID=UPI0023D9EB95|nr:uncharacterized protein LOC128951281 [Oppia nitens]XP_054152843.1 uncharacterized protein LOC128951620 [Oppia nitens]XP_054153974.1 uncharacterized protein LOC128952584 [Oppia nitens]XP_054154542.1 uncharacterized protein LOC128953093 [Oppia nitens]XP_054154791.1 uncharacterized protein LOC128953329 [Oppia nitens]XP_054155725.1 uncharacterized protein LOC128954179 [Oppia nitens]XP_054157789.1 uncharacterized protein LOC128956133 [Oppia nitens]XP_054161230.1 uncharacterized protein LOC1289